MIDKETTFQVIKTIICDNNMELLKIASELPETYDPDFLYVWVRAISAGEYWGPNKNADFFSERELLDSHHTFMDAHVFKNHNNKDVSAAIGGVIQHIWNNDLKCVELLIKIDRHLAPEIVRGFEKGFSTDVSMGCRVKETVCSICGNRAKVRPDFCMHVRTQRNDILPNGQRVFEYNIGPRFHDISVVLNGADRTAKVLEFVTPIPASKTPSMIRTAMNFEETLEKVAAEEVATLPMLKRANTISKLADIQKDILDKLYTLVLVNGLPYEELDESDIDMLDNDMKEAGVSLIYALEKEALWYPGKKTVKNVRNLALGTTGLALATNYYQGKRLRGEDMNPVQNFVADNPGTLPVAYLLGYLPALRGMKKLKNAVTKIDLSAPKLASVDMIDILNAIPEVEKYASDSVINIFTDKRIAETFKTAYDVDSEKLLILKLATASIFAEEEEDSLFKKAEESYGVEREDINNFLRFAYTYIQEDLVKEASVLGGIVQANLINPNSIKGIPVGFTAPLAVGSILDGYLLDRLTKGSTQGKSMSAPIKETKPVVTP